MKTKRIKAVRMLRNDMTGEVYRTCAPWQKKFAHRVYILPADAESYERMVEQMAKGAAQSLNRKAPAWFIETRKPQMVAALRAIGITPRTGRGGKGTR